MRVKQKPIEAEAVQWKGDNFAELKVFAGNDVCTTGPIENMRLRVNCPGVGGSESKWRDANVGDWIVKLGVHIFYVLTNAKFRRTYDIVEDGVR